MTIAAAKPLDDLLEKEWQQQVVQLFRQLGWTGYHTHDSRRSQPGFPDIVLVRERVLYLELKREKGALSEKQRDWIRRLADAGAEVYVVRPRHLEQLGLILTCRGVPWHGRGPALEAATRLREETRKETDR